MRASKKRRVPSSSSSCSNSIVREEPGSRASSTQRIIGPATSRGRTSLDVLADQRVRVHEQSGPFLCLVGEVGAVAGDPEHDVRQASSRPGSGSPSVRAASRRLLERQARRGDDGVDQLRVLEERLVVDERRDPLAVPLHPRRVTRALRSGGAAAGLVVDEHLRLGQPVPDREGRIAERRGRAHRAARPGGGSVRARRSGLPTAERASWLWRRPGERASGTVERTTADRTKRASTTKSETTKSRRNESASRKAASSPVASTGPSMRRAGGRRAPPLRVDDRDGQGEHHGGDPADRLERVRQAVIRRHEQRVCGAPGALAGPSARGTGGRGTGGRPS